MKRASLLISSVIICSLTFADNTQPVCPEFPFFKPQNGPLAITNCEFHHSYEDRIKQIEKTFGEINGRPIMMNLGGKLVLKYNGQTQTAEITPPAHHYIKAYSHIAFTIYLLLSQDKPGVLDTLKLQKLQKLQKDMQQAAFILPTLGLNHESRVIILRIVNFTDDFLNNIVSQRSWSNQELKDYYDKITPLFNQAIMISAQIELQTLDQIVTKWLSDMKPQDVKKLGIIVALPHQPRAQEISLQYFAKKFGYHFGEGAMHENGLVVLEGQYTEEAAYSLLARHYLDREASQTIFNDPERLQRDLLADAAHSILSRT